MTLVPMRFKNYEWRYNPEEISFECEKNIQELNSPKNTSKAQSIRHLLYIKILTYAICLCKQTIRKACENCQMKKSVSFFPKTLLLLPNSDQRFSCYNLSK